MPLVAVELSDGVPGVLRSVEGDNTRPLRATVLGQVNVGADDGSGNSSLPEKVLQVLPTYIVGELERISSMFQSRCSQGTHVCDIDLAAAATLWRSAKVALMSTAVWCSAVTSSALEVSTSGAGIAESRLGLTVFANVYETSHQVLVAERRHGVLRLLPSCIFHDATALYPSKSQSTSIQRTSQPSDHYL